MTSPEPQELRCKACGAALHYEPGAEVITCAHCGTEYVLESPTEFTVEYELAEDEPTPEVETPAPVGAPSYEDEALSWLQRGKKIEAIKVVRERTGMGLRESKEYVEALAAREGIPLRGGGSGACLVIVAVAVILGLAGLVSWAILMH